MKGAVSAVYAPIYISSSPLWAEINVWKKFVSHPAVVITFLHQMRLAGISAAPRRVSAFAEAAARQVRLRRGYGATSPPSPKASARQAWLRAGRALAGPSFANISEASVEQEEDQGNGDEKNQRSAKRAFFSVPSVFLLSILRNCDWRVLALFPTRPLFRSGCGWSLAQPRSTQSESAAFSLAPHPPLITPVLMQALPPLREACFPLIDASAVSSCHTLAENADPPFGDLLEAQDVFGGTPKTAVEMTALPNFN